MKRKCCYGHFFGRFYGLIALGSYHLLVIGLAGGQRGASISLPSPTAHQFAGGTLYSARNTCSIGNTN